MVREKQTANPNIQSAGRPFVWNRKHRPHAVRPALQPRPTLMLCSGCNTPPGIAGLSTSFCLSYFRRSALYRRQEHSASKSMFCLIIAAMEIDALLRAGRTYAHTCHGLRLARDNNLLACSFPANLSATGSHVSSCPSS